MQFFHQYPFLRLTCFLTLGILIGYYCPFISPFTLFIGFSASGLLYLFFCHFYGKTGNLSNRYNYNWLFGFTILLFLLAIGSWKVGQQRKDIIHDFSNTTLVTHKSIALQIIDTPLEKKKSVQILTQVIPIIPTNTHDSSIFDTPYDTPEIKVQFYVKKEEESLHLNEGDWIEIDPNVLLPRGKKSLNNIDTTNTNDTKKSDYEKYLNGKGISGSFYLPSEKWRKISDAKGFSFTRLSHKVQKHLVGLFRQADIGNEELGVLAALTIGDKSLLDKETRNSYATTGASHVLAVSGLHVGVIFLVFTQLLAQILRGENTKKLRTVLALFFLWGFTFVSGLSPSVVRASIMLTIASFAILLGQQTQTYNAVFASAFFMLLYSPRYLFDVGFQLSYMAVLSILMFQKAIEAIVETHHPLTQKAWSLLSVSLSAQLGTLPLTLYYFHQTSNLFWLSGFIVIPLATVILYLAILFWAFHWVPFLSSALSFLLGKTTMCMNISIHRLEQFERAVREGIDLRLFDILWLYFILLTLFSTVLKRNFTRLSFLLSSVLVYATYQTIYKLFFVY